MKQFLKSVNIWRNYRQEDCFTRSVRMRNVLHKYEEVVIDFTCTMKKLLLAVVALVSELILAVVSDKQQSD